jgi:hypothetical protein
MKIIYDGAAEMPLAKFLRREIGDRSSGRNFDEVDVHEAILMRLLVALTKSGQLTAPQLCRIVTGGDRAGFAFIPEVGD